MKGKFFRSPLEILFRHQITISIEKPRTMPIETPFNQVSIRAAGRTSRSSQLAIQNPNFKF